MPLLSSTAVPSPAIRGGTTQQSLQVQSALLPYALAFFGVALPVFAWAASFADNAAWMAATFAVFAINWGAFYGAVSWIRTGGAEQPAARLRVHILSGLLWAGAVAQIAAFAWNAGAAGETLLMMALAGAIACMFFTAPSLPSLLIVTPAAVAGPLIALFARPETRDSGLIAWGATALAMALCLILNRALRGQFALAAERESLMAECAASLERAEKLARSKSDIVSTLSHEIRNGLNGVTHVLAAAAGQGGRAAPSREQLAAALDAANDLIGVLNATLDSESAESGRLTLDEQPFDLIRLARDLVMLNRPHAAAKGVELSLHIDAALERSGGVVVADITRARQVLSNLIGNAVKYTTRGRIEARLELRGERLAVEIADTGPGLSPEELAEAFEPFRRVERTGAGVPGAGLGLPLSRRLAGLMRGEVTGQSAVGVGSCFTLHLPYDPAIQAEHEHGDGPLFSAPCEAPGERKLKVLIAEDDALNAAMLRAILEQLGHQVVHAQNGRRALDLLRLADFDLAMLDGRMPQMDGPATMRAIRALDGPAANLPVIAVIGGDADEARACIEAGAGAVLRKPVTVAGVARAVADASAAPRRAARTQAA